MFKIIYVYTQHVNTVLGIGGIKPQSSFSQYKYKI